MTGSGSWKKPLLGRAEAAKVDHNRLSPWFAPKEMATFSRTVSVWHVQKNTARAGRCCKTNANQSLVWQGYCPLCGAETAPLSESGGTVGLEMISLGKTAFLVEVVEDGGVDGGKLLETSHAPEALHRSFSSSEGEMGVLHTVVEPSPCCLFVG